MSIHKFTVARITCDQCGCYDDFTPEAVESQFIAYGGSWFRIADRTYCDWTCRERGEANFARTMAKVREAARQAQAERDLRNARTDRHTV